MDPGTGSFVTTQRQMFRKEDLGNGFVLYEVMNGKKCIPAVRSVTFRVSKPDTIDRIPLLNPIKIIKEHMRPYVDAVMLTDKTVKPIPDDDVYDNAVAIAIPKPNTITLFVDLSLTNEVLV